MPRIWCRQSNSKFIELYREQRCLWSIEDRSYRDKFCRRNAIQHIIDCMDMPDLTPMEVKKRIKSLRATYLIELKKVVVSMQSGEGKVYKPKLSWFEQMAEFINYPEEQLLVRSKIEVEPIIAKTEHESDEDDVEDPIYLIDRLNDWNAHSDHLLSSTHKPKKRAREDDEASSSRLSDDLQTVPPQITVASSAPAPAPFKDEFEVFGTHVASQLRLLSIKGTIKAQNEIQSVLTKYRLQDLRAKTDNSKLEEKLYLKTSEDEEAFSS